MAARGSFKRPLNLDNDGEADAVRVVKRQNSERTMVAEKLSLVTLTSANDGRRFQSAYSAPILHLPDTAHEVPSVSPDRVKNQQSSDTECSFFPKAKDCGPSKPPCDSPAETEEPPAQLQLRPSEEGAGRREGGLEDGGIMLCRASGDEGDGGSDAGGEEDEPDGHLRVIKKSFRIVEDAFDHVCSSAKNMIKSLDGHHNTFETETDNCTEGFPVHIRSPEGLSQPLPFGIHLKRHNLGYLVTNVRQDSYAWEAGIRDRDILTHLNQTDLRAADDRNVLENFMRVEEKFCLTFLREVQEGETKKLLEIKICVTFIIDVVHKVIEVKVTVSRSQVEYRTSSAPLYIAQEHDNKSPTYLNMDDRRMFMGTLTDDRAKFQLDFYVPSVFRDGQLCVIRKCDTSFVFNAVRGTVQEMDRSAPALECLVNKEYRPTGYVFQSTEKKGTYLTKSSGGSLVLETLSEESLFKTYPFRK